MLSLKELLALAEMDAELQEIQYKYRINWHISPLYVARARQMTLSRGGIIEKGIYYVDGLCAIQILLGRDSDPLPGGGV